MDFVFFVITFSSQEVEGTEEASRGWHPGLTVPSELSKLFTWEVDESCEMCQDQICEGLWMFMFQPLDKEVRIEDDWLAYV